MDDRDLERLFRASRRLDEAQAPAFSRFRRREASRPVRLIRFALPVSLALLVVTAGLVLLRPRLASRTPPPTVRSIAEWEAPTDFLLRTPGYELLGPPPPLHESIPRLPKVKRRDETKGISR